MTQERPMGIAGSPGAERPHAAGRSIRSAFALTVTLPVAGLVVLWGLALAALFGALGGHGFTWPSHDLATLTLSVGGGLVVVAACVLLAGAFIRRLRRDIRGLEAAARRLADEHLPQ